MKNILHLNLRSVSIVFGLMLAVVAGVVLYNHSSQAQSYTTINTALDVGSQGAAVTALQTFLSSNPLIYPEGIVSGYYGPLTQRAVVNFQIGYGLPVVGRVGPLTMLKINDLITSGKSIDVSGPFMYDGKVEVNSRSATISWKTDEPTVGKIFYSPLPLMATETSVAKTEPVIVGGSVSDNTLETSKSVLLSNLDSKKTYYYIIESIDASGNVSVSQQLTFATK